MDRRGDCASPRRKRDDAMIFTEIAETATITFDLETLEAMARACRVAAECGDGKYPYEAAASAFTAATMIARVHGDMPKTMTEHLACVQKRIMTD